MGGGPYQIATDDVQESQRRLKRRFRIVLENFPEFYMRASAQARVGRRVSIFIIRAVSTFIMRAVARVDSVRRGLVG